MHFYHILIIPHFFFYLGKLILSLSINRLGSSYPSANSVPIGLLYLTYEESETEGESGFPKGVVNPEMASGSSAWEGRLQRGLARSLFLRKLTSLPLERCRQAASRKQPSRGTPPGARQTSARA